MLVTVFARKKKSREGKEFTAYSGRLTNKSGEQINVSIRFRQECGSPKAADCPLNIEFDKADANLVQETYVREDTGEDATAYKLWIQAWKESEIVYRDTSLDDFE